jgi:flagellar biosynthetic protein FlhB
MLLGGTIVVIVIFFEILQLRGLIFSAHPLKPDFSRINPGKGLKRIFSMKMLKDALKNIFKMTVYSTCAMLVTIYCIRLYDDTINDGTSLILALTGGSYRLLFVFALLAIFFVILDQIISRQEFRKQMRMSKSELQRENKDREGEPRQKQKRKQLHAEFVKQAQNLGDLPGSDMLIVNPQHYAVGLVYDPNTMIAPELTTKGRNKFALYLKSEARRLAIPIIDDPPLARAIFKQHNKGDPIAGEHFVALATHYIQLRQAKAAKDQESKSD